MGTLRWGLVAATLMLALLPLWLSAKQPGRQRITAPTPAPRESYARPPEAPFDRSDYVVKINQMSS